MQDIQEIGRRLVAGESLYAIAKALGESLASLRRLRAFLAEATAVVTTLARALGLLEAIPPEDEPTLEAARRFPTWADFTHSFSRAFYPKRFPLLRTHTIRTG